MSFSNRRAAQPHVFILYWHVSVLTSDGVALEASQRVPCILRATRRGCIAAAMRAPLLPANAAFCEPMRAAAALVPAALDTGRTGATAAFFCACLEASGTRTALEHCVRDRGAIPSYTTLAGEEQRASLLDRRIHEISRVPPRARAFAVSILVDGVRRCGSCFLAFFAGGSKDESADTQAAASKHAESRRRSRVINST